MTPPIASATPDKRSEARGPGEIDRRAALHALRMGTRYMKTRAWDTAAIWLRQAVQILPGFFEAYYLLGDVYMELGQSDEAIETYDLAIQLRPDETSAHLKLGLAYIAKNNWNAALGQYHTLRTLNEVVAGELFDKIIYSFNYEMFESLFNHIQETKQ
jgi:tetratricopeptide (TPR) repeat protein